MCNNFYTLIEEFLGDIQVTQCAHIQMRKQKLLNCLAECEPIGKKLQVPVCDE